MRLTFSNRPFYELPDSPWYPLNPCMLHTSASNIKREIIIELINIQIEKRIFLTVWLRLKFSE